MRALDTVSIAPLHLSDRLSGKDPEAGMTTAEYAVGTVAACGFAAVLYEVVTSGTVHALVAGVITRALGAVA